MHLFNSVSSVVIKHRSGCSFFLFTLFLLFANVSAFALSPARKTEMRGVWIATVANIDWPERGKSSESQKQSMIQILDALKKSNINTVAFQVRPTADAFYKSDLEPWSAYLTGRQGQAPDGDFDPLQFVIEEAHKRCMEVHVWMNPYRVINSGTTEQLDPRHLYFERPELFVSYGGKLYFNPAYQDVRDYLTMIVMDIVLRYDLDAVHFDDYFYPYKEKGQEFDDERAFMDANDGFSSKDNWRRNNVNMIIEQLQHTIKAAKPWVQFGVSPFGSNGTNYNELYADVTLWMRKGWVDYVAPQIYWSIGHKTSDFSMLYDWWAEEAKKSETERPCTFYTGLYASALDLYAQQQKAWSTPNELARQLNLGRKREKDKGAFFYSSRYFLRNLQGLQDSLQRNYYRYPALPPACAGGDASEAPANVRYDGDVLSWSPVAVGEDTSKAVRYYVVYELPLGNTDNELSADRIVTTTVDTQFRHRFKENCRIAVTSFNLFRRESEPAIIFSF
ncbi:MAG: family 10 glycosylhydrolase [Paludibacteraceae bacterium]|nr:family 10 glycosylhydrolase [Paludibacteraceae bacterium]